MFKIIDNGVNAQRWQAPCFESANESVANFNSDMNPRLREQKKFDTKQAYEEAFAKGYKEGLEQGAHEVKDKTLRLISLMNTMASPLEDLDKNVIDELVELSMTVVKHMVRRELKTSPDEIIAVVKEALSLLPIGSSNVHLELHPEDAIIIRDTLGSSEAEQRWLIIEDPMLSRGGCRVLTETSRIDASVENRLNATIAAVMGSERQQDFDS